MHSQRLRTKFRNTKERERERERERETELCVTSYFIQYLILWTREVGPIPDEGRILISEIQEAQIEVIQTQRAPIECI